MDAFERSSAANRDLLQRLAKKGSDVEAEQPQGLKPLVDCALAARLKPRPFKDDQLKDDQFRNRNRPTKSTKDR
jgi:hypothetical protein